MRTRSSLGLSIFLNWLMICVGVFGSMLCLCTAFPFPVFPNSLEPVFPAFWVVPPVLALLGCCCFRGKRGKYWALGFLGLFLLFFLLTRRELTESFRNLWGQLSARYARGYDQLQDYVPREPTTAEGARGALLIVAILETYLCALSVCLWRRTFPAALALLPGILPCFVLTDTPPALLPLFAAALSLLTQAYSQAVRRREAGEEPKAILLGALLGAGLLALLLLLFPREHFKPPVTWQDLSRKMERWGMEQSNRGNLNAGLAGNPDQVDLRELGALPNHPATILYARADQDGYFYLRGSSYCDFDGSRWLRGAERDWNQRCLFPYLGRRSEGKLSIEYVEPLSLLFTTYETTALPAAGETVSDAYVRNPAGRLRCELEYLTDPGMPPYSDESYGAWVAERCLALPDETRAGVLDWWAKNHGELPAEPISQGVIDWTFEGSSFHLLAYDFETLADQIAEKVSQCAAYNRNPMPVPDDADFCTWFLNEAEEGYCVHYATACTALLRALGIPARYVSGYVCPLTAGRSTAVTNLQAHAWVEIWSGGRWICVEPTPGDATEFAGRNDLGGDTEPSDAEETVYTDLHEPLTETLTPPTDFTNPEVSKPGHSRSPEASEEGGGYNNHVEEKPLDLTTLWIFLGVTGFLALVLGRRALALRLWERKLARASVNERARLYYRRILRLSRHGGGVVTAEAERAAKKASFSQHSLSDEELSMLRQLHDQQACRVAIKSFWNKLYCRYILAII